MFSGVQKTVAFFGQRKRWRAGGCFGLGVALVMFRWVKVGILIEAFGILNLFGDFFPVIVAFLRQLPVIGDILNAPAVVQFIDKLTGANARLPV